MLCLDVARLLDAAREPAPVIDGDYAVLLQVNEDTWSSPGTTLRTVHACIGPVKEVPSMSVCLHCTI